MKLFCAWCRPARVPRLVPQGFSLWGLLLGPLWLLARGAWLPALVAVVLMAVARTQTGLAAGGTGLLVAFAIGLFGNELCGMSLRISGWRMAHVVRGADRDAAFGRLLEEHPEYLADVRA